MKIIIVYDIGMQYKNGNKRLRKVSNLCQKYGQRVQLSVFECELTNTQYITFLNEIEKIINNKYDSIRIYKNFSELKTYGIKPSYDREEVLFF